LAISIQRAYQEIRAPVPEPRLETFEQIDARQDAWLGRYAMKSPKLRANSIYRTGFLSLIGNIMESLDLDFDVMSCHSANVGDCTSVSSIESPLHTKKNSLRIMLYLRGMFTCERYVVGMDSEKRQQNRCALRLKTLAVAGYV
jgi:hypothetical protein